MDFEKIRARISYSVSVLYNYACRYNSWIGGLVACIFVLILLCKDPLPSLHGVKPDDIKDLISWDLSRQLTHAALTLSALVGVFSMLQMKSKILQKWETKLTFTGILAFLSYEYFKLIRSFQIVNILENKLPIYGRAEHIFQLDLLQQYLLKDNSCWRVIQSLGIAVIVFLLIRIYNHSLKLSRN